MKSKRMFLEQRSFSDIMFLKKHNLENTDLRIIFTLGTEKIISS